MASKIIFLLAVLCAMQVAHAASVQKRDLIGDLINTAFSVINPIQQQIQGGITQALSAVQGAQSLIANVTGNVTAGLQATATAILTQVSSVPRCATALTANVSNIVSQTGTNIQKCATPVMNNLSNASANVLNVSGLVTQLQQQVQAAANSFNIFNPFSFLSLPTSLLSIISSGIQLAANVPNVLAQMTAAFSNATAQIVSCGTTAAGNAGQQLNTILANVQSCVLSG